MAFQFPEAFYLLVVFVPIFIILRKWQRRTKYVLDIFKSAPVHSSYYILRAVCLFTFMGSLIAITAKPYSQLKSTADFVFLVDVSRSMQARISCDLPSYLDRAKVVMNNVISGIPEGRFGIFAFERLTFPITQMTYDHDYLESVIKYGIYDSLIYDRTDTRIGTALSILSRKKSDLPDIYGNVKYAVLLTDGYFEGDYRKFLAEPLAQLEKANITIIPVGIGDAKAAPIPIKNEGKCVNKFIVKEGNRIEIPLKTEVLEYIASSTKGKYFGEIEMDGLIRFLRTNGLQKRLVNSFTSDRQKTDMSWIFLVLATISLFGYVAMQMDVRFRGKFSKE